MPAETPSAVGKADQARRDAASCVALSDVMTIVENADLGVGAGRMEVQEQQGWYELAARVLGRIPSSDDTVVGRGIADLQAIAPGLAAGEGTMREGFDAPAWHDTLATLVGPCEAVDAELVITPFTGG
ncbi:hypothetical protein [Sanguibacter sp. 25GB23B1]|uniref:hypothetical protein n=1 Tax=unclassified Sanguibacter TaxID=2645534 RepID=UPI0032AEEC46